MQSVSVVIASFNGEKFIRSQIESILSQSVQPCEIIVCDDRSKDNTIKILEEIREYSPIPIKIYINEVNLGVTKNFAKGIAMASGQFVALSDQDDYWIAEKLKQQIEYLQNNPELSVVFSNLSIVDSELRRSGRNMFNEVRFTNELQQRWDAGGALEILLKHSIVTGCTLLFQNSYIRSNLKYLDGRVPGTLHDGIIAIRAAIDHKIGFINEELVLYRQHDAQVVGAESIKTSKIEVIMGRMKLLRSSVPIYEQKKALEHRLNWLSALEMPASELTLTKNKISFIEKRINYLGKNFPEKFTKVLSNVINKNYFCLEHPLTNIVRDMITKR